MTRTIPSLEDYATSRAAFLASAGGGAERWRR
mgnify:CR=1 FL=1